MIVKKYLLSKVMSEVQVAGNCDCFEELTPPP